MNCAVTGAHGWVGGCIAAALRARGHQVLALTRRPKRGDETYFQLGQDPTDILRSVDVVVHAAHDFTCLSKKDAWVTNVLGGEKVLAAARKAGARQVVCISSVAAFEGCASAYGCGKLALERVTLGEGGIVVRPGLCWSESPRGIYGTLARASRLPWVPVFDGGNQPLHLAHVDDVAAAVTHAVEHADQWPRIPVVLAHPRPWNFADLVRTLAERQGRRTRSISVPSRLAEALLGMLETFLPRMPIRRDNLVSLLHPPTTLDHAPAASLGLSFRSWDVRDSHRSRTTGWPSHLLRGLVLCSSYRLP